MVADPVDLPIGFVAVVAAVAVAIPVVSVLSVDAYAALLAKHD